MGRPGRLLPPAHFGGSGDAHEVDGVGLQAFQQVLRVVARQLQLGDGAVAAGAVGQAVGRDVAAAQLGWQQLPGHLDVGRAAAGEAELRGSQGYWGGQRRSVTKDPYTRIALTSSDTEGSDVHN